MSYLWGDPLPEKPEPLTYEDWLWFLSLCVMVAPVLVGVLLELAK